MFNVLLYAVINIDMEQYMLWSYGSLLVHDT